MNSWEYIISRLTVEMMQHPWLTFWVGAGIGGFVLATLAYMGKCCIRYQTRLELRRRIEPDEHTNDCEPVK